MGISRIVDEDLAVEVLSRSSSLSVMSVEALSHLLMYLRQVEAPPGEVVVREGEVGHDIYFILQGEAEVTRGRTPIGLLHPGQQFGAMAVLTGHVRSATIIARTRLVLLRLHLDDWEELKAAEPALAVQVVEALFAQAREDLSHVTEVVGALLRGRSLPRAVEVQVQVGDQTKNVQTGTRAQVLLPAEVDGSPVVAALLNNKPVSLDTPIVTATTLAPMPLSHWEGRAIYARSLGLLVLDAAHELDPKVKLAFGPSRGTEQLLLVQGVTDLQDFAGRLTANAERLAAGELKIRHEQWLVDEAREYFRTIGWANAELLLQTFRGSTVPLVSWGRLYALAFGPFLPDTSLLRGFKVEAANGGLVLQLGRVDPRRNGFPGSRPPESAMAAEHLKWMTVLGVDSVGAFNTLCINGQVSTLLRVAEGFHEKQIGRIADTIADARKRLRIISIAGPSSSGKTTFIKRLSVQLRINGLTPISLSLDDYYVDRETTPKGEDGKWDFEALEALNLPLLHEHLKRLLAGETVTLARYDFKAGKSHPQGGQQLNLTPGDLLLIEGIHGLNPKLLGDIPEQGQTFKIFIHPATSLPFDRLSRVSATDLRLLRRIIRDRHSRGYSAADNIMQWPNVQAGERKHIFPFQGEADAVFDTSLVYEPAVLKVYAERYLLEVPRAHPAFATAWRLRHLVDRFVAIYPDHVPPTSIIREFIGGSGFEY
ncbi:MAG: cyclic nucleotide-binding domain-containing protein [Myxococcales bacterium]|nr:cyclic nucleotide-binding domain-containing protein [Myxococcales bacterium]